MRKEIDGTGRIAVIGVGNVLLGDDGFGPYVVSLLRRGWDLPPSVELIDAGTPSLDLAGYLDGREVAIVLDAVSATGFPGELRVYRRDELRRMPMRPRLSPHDPAVHEALWIAELGGNGPREVMLVGAIPASSEVGIRLSLPMRDAAAAAAELVIDELIRVGVVPAPRDAVETAEAWWMPMG